MEYSYSFLKEHSESEEHAQRFAKAKIEANDKVDEAGQDTDKVADQELVNIYKMCRYSYVFISNIFTIKFNISSRFMVITCDVKEIRLG